MGIKKILLVDDEEVWRRLLSRVFSEQGYEVAVASSCAEGLAVFERERPDCLVLDFHLGDGTAADICKKVRGQAETAHIPIVIFTSDTSLKDCGNGVHKPNAVVHKTSPLADLVAAVQACAA